MGHALAEVFGYESGCPDVHIYDKFLASMSDQERRAAIQKYEIVFIAVPTPAGPEGRCDVSAEEEVVAQLEPPLCLESTVP